MGEAVKHSSHRRRPKLTKTQRRVLRHYSRPVAPHQVSGIPWRNLDARQIGLGLKLHDRGYLEAAGWGLWLVPSPKGWAALERGY